jgi:hypothetical protein
MSYKSIVCLEDFLRPEYPYAKELFFNLMREPIRQAIDIDIGSSPRFRKYTHNLNSDFDIEQFRSFCPSNSWIEYFFGIPDAAADYLVGALPPDALIISYEMPQWLETLLSRRAIPYIDIRISPIRFARDLYIALRSNVVSLMRNIEPWAVLDEEIRLEASLLTAMARHNPAPKVEDHSFVFLGQTEDDASIVNHEGRFVRLEDYEQKISSFDRQIYYLAHPFASDAHKQRESTQLSRFKPVRIIQNNIYDLLASTLNLSFMAISSGALQEAFYFDKDTVTLFKPLCPIRGSHAYYQIHFETLIKPKFWHDILKIKDTPPRCSGLPSVVPNALRTIHNMWWGYGTFVKQNSKIDKETFNLSGGNELRDQIAKLLHISDIE